MFMKVYLLHWLAPLVLAFMAVVIAMLYVKHHITSGRASLCARKLCLHLAAVWAQIRFECWRAYHLRRLECLMFILQCRMRFLECRQFIGNIRLRLNLFAQRRKFAAKYGGHWRSRVLDNEVIEFLELERYAHGGILKPKATDASQNP